MSTHQEKQHIFDAYAKTREFDNWNDLKNCCIEFDIDIDEYIFEACDLVQEEQQNKIAEKTLIDVKVPDLPSWRGTFYSSTDVQIIVDKDSIINPENLIK